MAIGTLAATRAHAVEVGLITENDILMPNATRDDLYTFAIGFNVEHKAYRISLREDSFTDRKAGARFDETNLTVRRDVLGVSPLRLRFEGGFLHVGRGLFGQPVQNEVHRLIGMDEVLLRYPRSEIYPSLGLEAELPFRVGARTTVSPHVEASSAPGFRSFTVLGAQSRWQPLRRLAFQALGGWRFTRTQYELLEPHLARVAPIARVSLTLFSRLVGTWTYNDYGDRRQHVSLGYSIPVGEARR
jgi:hypothetical protein